MKRRSDRFAAKLLFQFCVGKRGWARRMLCEETTIVLRANSTRQALRKAKQYGNARQFNYANTDGRVVHYEFVGILDLLHLGLETRDEEVWYEIKQLLEPMKRRAKLIRSDTELMLRGQMAGVKRNSLQKAGDNA